jgi:hypothetical protein
MIEWIIKSEARFVQLRTIWEDLLFQEFVFSIYSYKNAVSSSLSLRNDEKKEKK